jgi:hypothetical protein
MSRRTLLAMASAITLSYFFPLAVALSLAADESFLSKPPEQWTESEALQVLNDSPWAHTVTTTTQDFQCDYEHPAFAGMYTDEFAQRMDSFTTPLESTVVKPDGAEYVIRLVSVKPIQAAVDRLISLDEKWAHRYYSGVVLEHEKPTNLEEHFYNPADLITIAVVLKRPGPGGTSFLDYAFDKDKKAFPGPRVRHPSACAAIKTSDGQSGAVIVSLGVDKKEYPSATWFSFPSSRKGKPLISRSGEEVQFRFIADQRVFETTFMVNASDLFDGTERVLHIPATVDEPSNAPAR